MTDLDAPVRTLRPRNIPAAPGTIRRRARLIRWSTLLVVLVLWQLLAPADSRYLAPPSRIVLEGVPYLATQEALSGLASTVRSFLIAFVIAVVCGVLVGVGFGLSRRAGPVAGDAAFVLYTLPQVPLYPLFVLIFGTGATAETAFGVSHGVLPVVLISVAAASRVDSGLVAAARSMGAGRIRTVRSFVLPAVLPELVTALRVGASLTLIGVLVGQTLVSVGGVGGLIAQLIGSLRPAELNAVVLAVALAAILLNLGLGRLERRLGRWRPHR